MEQVDSTTTTNIQNELKKLQQSIPQIQTSVVVAVEGLPITSYSSDQSFDEMKELAFAAVTASLLALGEKTVMDVSEPGDVMSRIVIESEERYVISIAVGEKAVLTVVCLRKDVKAGYLYYQVDIAAKAIAEILS